MWFPTWFYKRIPAICACVGIFAGMFIQRNGFLTVAQIAIMVALILILEMRLDK